MALPSGLVGPVTISRYPATGAYDTDGFWQEPTPANVTITGLVHAEKDQDILMRDGGGYADGVIKIYSNDILYAKVGAQQADRHTLNGKVYEVYEVNDPYSNLSLDHYRCRLRKVDEKTNGA